LHVTVAGAGMAGLVAAARLRELGHQPRVLEKGTRPGGSMLLSSCVVWRHLEWERFREECPGGDERLQRLVWERLDGGLRWLESLGAEPVWRDTENPLTTGRRYEPQALARLLVEAAGGVELETPLPEYAVSPLLLATGGFPGRLARERGLLLRANPWSEGDGLDLALARGAVTTPGMDEFYGRVMPAPPAQIGEEGFVPLAQLYGREARVFTDEWREITPQHVAWHENDLAQLIGQRAWYVVAETNERIEAARAAGGSVVEREEGLAVHVAAAVTHTIGGLAVDAGAHVTGVDGLWAAGVDAGGVATGGYASGLAQALVLGLAAAESIAGS
jgi:putative NAD(P)-binding protein/FAD binding domain-containing protein